MIQYVLALLFTREQQLETIKQATRKPTTPGDIPLYECLGPFGSKINELTELLHAHHNSVSALINNNRKLTTEIAFRLAEVFGTTVDFWLSLQAVVDLQEVGNNMHTQEGLGRIETVAEHLARREGRAKKVTQGQSITSSRKPNKAPTPHPASKHHCLMRRLPILSDPQTYA